MVLLGIVLAAVAVYAAVRLQQARSPQFNGTAYPDSPPAPDFQLTAQDGQPRTLSDFAGSAVLVYFGFTRCPDVCPITLSRLTALLNEEKISPDDVNVLLISVDPEYDTPERLAEYVARFGPQVTGLTADTATVRAVMEDYGAYAQQTTGNYGENTLAHTDIIFGIDPVGRLRVLLHADEEPELLESDIKALIRATG
jgi:protein SCO1